MITAPLSGTLSPTSKMSLLQRAQRPQKHLIENTFKIQTHHEHPGEIPWKIRQHGVDTLENSGQNHKVFSTLNNPKPLFLRPKIFADSLPLLIKNFP